MIRSAVVADIPALTAIENRCFDSDRVSPRSFRHLLTRANAAVLVEENRRTARGYAAVLFRRGTSLARLYSIAVDPRWRRQAIGRALIEEAERIAILRNAAYMRLEVRSDNRQARAVYHQAGYRQFAIEADYYDDHTDAIRLEKTLVPHLRPSRARVPYYAQTLDMTCGPACLMMAMKALEPSLKLDRALELRLWREATTIFMASGHGGCGPFGLALSAWNRGFAVEVHANRDVEMFVKTVRSEEKREVIRLVHQDLLDEISHTGVALYPRPLGVAKLREKFEAGGVPVVLISPYRLNGEKAPHWVTVAGFDEHFVYIHDPYIDAEDAQTATDCAGIPLLPEEFGSMTVHGRARRHAVLIVGKR